MSDSFKAILVSRDEDKRQSVDVVDLTDADLMEGDVTVAVEATTVNYKDGLAITGKAPVVRRWPLVPGIDFAGTVVASDHPDWRKGDRVIVTGRMEQRTWEGGDGAKRSKVEIVASDIGASVRFAEVQVARITRLETGPPGADAVAAAMADTTADARVDEEPF